ncbi:MAG: RimK family alpha-L-glutamate ligase [Pseudomonadota bacterium]
MPRQVIALEGRLRRCSNVTTLGVHPNFGDYSDPERSAMDAAPVIYYPSSQYAFLFSTIGKRTFPGYAAYVCAQDKIRQTALFQMAGIPHPPTRVFYGSRQHQKILSRFTLPLIAKIPRGSALGRGVFLIQQEADLAAFCSQHHTVYIQKYLPVSRDIRVVVVGGRVVHAYWRHAPELDFRSNVAVGGRISFDPVPQSALALAVHTAATCRWDDVGIDIIDYDGSLFVIEGNMKYGREGFRQAGIDYTRLMEGLIADGTI